MAGVAAVLHVQTLTLGEHLRLDRALPTRGADPHESSVADEHGERHPRGSLAGAAGCRGRPSRLARGLKGHRPAERAAGHSSNSPNTTRVLPRGKFAASAKTPGSRSAAGPAQPLGTATYCFPPTAYVMEEARWPGPVENCHSSSPD